MSFDVSQIEKLAEEISHTVVGTSFFQCEAIDPKRFILVLNGEKQTYRLLICLEEPFLRFHLCSKKGVPTPLTDKINSFLSGYKLAQMCSLNHDRILSLTFSSKSDFYIFIVEFFSKSPNLYIIDSNRTILFSHQSTNLNQWQLPFKRLKQEDNVQRPLLTSAQADKHYQQLEERYAFYKAFKAVERALQSRLKQALKNKAKSERNLQYCKEWETIEHEGELLKSNFHLLKKGMKSLTVLDYKINEEVIIMLNPKRVPKEELAHRFKQSKKLKSGIVYAENRLISINDEIHSIHCFFKELEQVDSYESLYRLEKHANISSVKEPKSNVKAFSRVPYLTFKASNGASIFVGKSAADNEKLTFSYAKGSDLWFHVAGYPGSHVILQSNKAETFDQESVQDAALLALYHSKAKSQGESEVHMTQCKYVAKGGYNRLGKVQISHHHILFVRDDPERYRRIISRRGNTE